MFDEENCMKIWYILTDYSLKKISAHDARDKLLDCDLSQVDSFLPHIRDRISDLLASEDFEDSNYSEKEDKRPRRKSRKIETM